MTAAGTTTDRLAALSRLATRRPLTTIGTALLVVLVAATGLSQVEIRTDGDSLVPVDSPDIRAGAAIERAFDLHDQFVIVVRTTHPDGIFNVRTLALVRDLTDDASAIEGIDPAHVTSLGTERGDRVTPGTLNVRTFLVPLPTTPVEIDRFRGDLRRIDLYSGTLLSRDETAAGIFVGIPTGADRHGLVRALREMVAARADEQHEVRVVGGPVAEVLLGNHILDDLGVPRAIVGESTERRPAPGAGLGPLGRARNLVARTIGLLPVAIGLMSLILFLFFRRVVAVMITMTEVLACLVFIFGIMGHAGVPVYLTIAVMPVILTAVGIADELHVFHRYREHVHLAWADAGDDADPQRVTIVDRTMNEMARPVVLTSVTTAIGFLSFTLSPIGAVRAFGLLTATGVLFCMLWSLTVVPACLTLIGPRRCVTPPTAHRARPSLVRLAEAVVRRRRVIVTLAALVIVATPFGVRRILIQDSWLDGFAPDSVFAHATTAFNRDFLGSHLLILAVDAGGTVLSGELAPDDLGRHSLTLPAEAVPNPDARVGDWVELRVAETQLPVVAEIVAVEADDEHVVLTTERRGAVLSAARGLDEVSSVPYLISPRSLASPETLDVICGLEAFLASRTEDTVGGVLGPCGFLSTTNFLLAGRNEERRRPPETRRRANLVWLQFERIRGVRQRRHLAEDGLQRGIVTAFLTEANFRSTRRLIAAIRAYEVEHLTPPGLSITLAGDVAVSQTLIAAIVSTQVRSVLLSLAGILLATAIFGRGLGWGVRCVLPCALAVLVNFAAMGVFGVPLGVATSMFAGMVLGIGVDYAIHLMERYRFAMRGGLEPPAALVDAMTATGPAVVIDAVAVAGGFGVLMLSQVPANARLGGLLALSVLTCFLATLVLLPALLSLRPPRNQM